MPRALKGGQEMWLSDAGRQIDDGIPRDAILMFLISATDQVDGCGSGLGRTGFGRSRVNIC